MFMRLTILICLLSFNVYADDKNINEEEIKEIIKNYILESPEIIIESLDKYTSDQKKKEKEGFLKILNNFHGSKYYESLPRIGNSKSEQLIVEFIDYNCGYCKNLPTIHENFKI